MASPTWLAVRSSDVMRLGASFMFLHEVEAIFVQPLIKSTTSVTVR